MKTKNTVLPVFLDHAGCPFRCVFCNQEKSVGSAGSPEKQIDHLLHYFRPTPKRSWATIAFYGGDFLRLPETRRMELINACQKPSWLEGFSASVRPDSIDDSSALWLKEHGFVQVEIGGQCLDDGVLEEIHRGHTVQDVMQAVCTAKGAGLAVGLQLMLGLPGQSESITALSNKRAATCRPDFIRIFPAIVLEDTGLEKRAKNNEYSPLSFDQALDISARSLAFFASKGIRVAQIGLHPSEPLVSGNAATAGPFDPRFGERVRQRLTRLTAEIAIQKTKPKNEVLLSVPSFDLSRLIGPKRSGLAKLKQRFALDRIKVSVDKELNAGWVVASTKHAQSSACTSQVWQHYFAEGFEA